jgi:hypothetical protein
MLQAGLPGAELQSDNRQAGRAGIYVQLDRLSPPNRIRNLVATNPLVSTVMLPLWWRTFEPSHGQFDTGALKTEIAYWKGKRKLVVFQVTPYGQQPNDAQTPAWLYDEAGVQTISFAGGGSANGGGIRVPAVWKMGFVKTYTEPLVKALAEAVDGDPTIAYVQIGLGHLGGITAQPSKFGGIAFMAAGWTPEVWEAYCLRTADVYRAQFQRTPLLAIAEGLLIRNRARRGYEREVGRLVGELGRRGVSIIHSDIVDQVDKPQATEEIARLIKEHLGSLESLAAAGKIRIGLGDDWPLWVPESRRNQGPTLHRDDSFLERSLTAAFGGVQGIPETGMTIFYTQLPAVLASNPLSTRDHEKESYYRPTVERIMAQARDRLLQNDQAVFGRQ